MSIYQVTITATVVYDTDQEEAAVTNAEEAHQDVIDFLATGDAGPDFFDIEVTKKDDNAPTT